MKKTFQMMDVFLAMDKGPMLEMEADLTVSPLTTMTKKVGLRLGCAGFCFILVYIQLFNECHMYQALKLKLDNRVHSRSGFFDFDTCLFHRPSTDLHPPKTTLT